MFACCPKVTLGLSLGTRSLDHPPLLLRTSPTSQDLKPVLIAAETDRQKLRRHYADRVASDMANTSLQREPL